MAMLFLNQWRVRILLGLCLLFPVSSWAGTVVRVNTSLGEFFVELYDTTTPRTVENFLGYVNGGLYNGTIVHRLAPGFVIQGGWITFIEEVQSFMEIPVGNAVVNEFRVSNQRGTIAMAKIDGNPNSATSQWFINLGNNTFLDTNNGGFTVFGRVLGNGMQVVDAIGALTPMSLVPGMDRFPTINFTGGRLLNSNLVFLNMSVVGSTTGDAAVFSPETGRLRTYVDAGALGLMSVEFALTSESPALTIKLDPARMFPLNDRVANMAVFDNASGQLTIPEIRVNGAVAWRNVRFQLTNTEQLIFTLTGLE